MRIRIRLLAFSCALLLAACGSPSSPPPPAPQITAVSPMVAARGETIMVTGTGFGTQGDLTVGGVPADIVAWSDTDIEAVVPSDAPGAWQEVVVATTGGESEYDGLFVGVEYTGPADSLQQFILDAEPGTAVLLEAETYSVGGIEFFIDNVDLYGRGPGETVIAGDAVFAMADHGNDVTVADLTIRTEDLSFMQGSVRGYPIFSSMAAPADLDAEALLQAAVAAHAVEPAAALPSASLTFERLVVDPESGGGSPTIGIFLPIAPILDLTFRDVVLEDDTAQAAIVTGGALSVIDSSFEVAEGIFAAIGNTLEVTGSQLVFAGDAQLGADKGLYIEDSMVVAENGDMEIIGAVSALFGGSVMGGGPVSITRSTVSAQDADISDLTELGYVQMVTMLAPLSLVDNHLLRADSDFVTTVISFLGDGDITIVGNADIRAGRAAGPNIQEGTFGVLSQAGELPSDVIFAGNSVATTAQLVITGTGTGGYFTVADNAFDLGSTVQDGDLVVDGSGYGSVDFSRNTGSLYAGTVAIYSEAETEVTVSDNDITFTQSSTGLELSGSGTTTVTGNTFTAVDPGAGALALFVGWAEDPLALRVSENTFSGFVNALRFVGDALVETAIDARLNDNVFDMEFTAAPQVAELTAVGDVIVAENNVWGTETDVATLMSYVTRDGLSIGWGGDIDIDPVKAP